MFRAAARPDRPSIMLLCVIYYNVWFILRFFDVFFFIGQHRLSVLRFSLLVSHCQSPAFCFYMWFHSQCKMQSAGIYSFKYSNIKISLCSHKNVWEIKIWRLNFHEAFIATVQITISRLSWTMTLKVIKNRFPKKCMQDGSYQRE